MAEDLITDDMLATFQSLAAALAQLEGAGEFTAAAHVAAAMDVVELRLGKDAPRPEKVNTGDALAFIVRRMIDSFGDSAEAVARRQLNAACGAPLMAWAAIVNRLC